MNKEKKHAYLIMSHNNVSQLNDLIRMLDDKRNDIYLHIDAKSSVKKEELILPQKGKLIFVDRMRVYWADYSQVECELRLLKKAVSENHAYYHLLSGSDLPLKSQAEIHEYFLERNSLFLHYTTQEKVEETLSFVKYYNVFQKKLCEANRGKNFSIYKAFNKLFLFVQRCFRINRIPKKLVIKKGANWFSIPHDFAEYVVQHEERIKSQFSMTRSPDEFFMQTLAYNSKFKQRIFRFREDDCYESCLRLIDWQRGNPYVFRHTDYRELTNSDMFFARKFDSTFDKQVITELIKSVMDRGEKDV